MSDLAALLTDGITIDQHAHCCSALPSAHGVTCSLVEFGDLMGCELAVLSACETNVGLRRAGQGIQSLQTALHTAGVRIAITSPWKVDDAATRRLMELFYTKLWSEGLGSVGADGGSAVNV